MVVEHWTNYALWVWRRPCLPVHPVGSAPGVRGQGLCWRLFCPCMTGGGVWFTLPAIKKWKVGEICSSCRSCHLSPRPHSSLRTHRTILHLHKSGVRRFTIGEQHVEKRLTVGPIIRNLRIHALLHVVCKWNAQSSTGGNLPEESHSNKSYN